MPAREVISTDDAPRTGLPYAQAVRASGLVFVAGQVAFDPATGKPISGDVKEQTRRVIRNIEAILRAAGTSLDLAVDSLCLLRRVEDFDAFNEAYREFFGPSGPPRTTVQAAVPRDGLDVEIRIIAAMPDPT
jgi:2-iminobutanoate/2-iminopropanoate deaminase